MGGETTVDSRRRLRSSTGTAREEEEGAAEDGWTADVEVLALRWASYTSTTSCTQRVSSSSRTTTFHLQGRKQAASVTDNVTPAE